MPAVKRLELAVHEGRHRASSPGTVVPILRRNEPEHRLGVPSDGIRETSDGQQLVKVGRIVGKFQQIRDAGNRGLRRPGGPEGSKALKRRL